MSRAILRYVRTKATKRDEAWNEPEALSPGVHKMWHEQDKRMIFANNGFFAKMYRDEEGARCYIIIAPFAEFQMRKAIENDWEKQFKRICSHLFEWEIGELHLLHANLTTTPLNDGHLTEMVKMLDTYTSAQLFIDGEVHA